MSKIRWKPILITAAAVVLALAMINACVLLLLDANEKSKDARILDRAVTEVSSVADTLEATDGSLKKTGNLLRSHKIYDVSDDTMTLYYDDDMNPASVTDSAYIGVVEKSKDSDDLSVSYVITISDTASDKEIYSLSFKALKSGGGD